MWQNQVSSIERIPLFRGSFFRGFTCKYACFVVSLLSNDIFPPISFSLCLLQSIGTVEIEVTTATGETAQKSSVNILDKLG